MKAGDCKSGWIQRNLNRHHRRIFIEGHMACPDWLQGSTIVHGQHTAKAQQPHVQAGNGEQMRQTGLTKQIINRFDNKAAGANDKRRGDATGRLGQRVIEVGCLCGPQLAKQ
ncbi:hypothetical protein OAN83_00085 [Alphaproteobacteria bacterium]|nr:hypothetical protein [Alphaproteobacteria bacterium]